MKVAILQCFQNSVSCLGNYAQYLSVVFPGLFVVFSLGLLSVVGILGLLLTNSVGLLGRSNLSIY